MKIELNVTPDDLAKIIVDIKYTHLKCKSVLEQIVSTVQSDIEIKLEELEQMQIISDEAAKTLINGDKENG